MHLCPYCNKNIARKTNKYCSSKCMQNFERDKRIKNWLEEKWDGNTKFGLSSTIRKFLLSESQYKCSQCLWNAKNPFTGETPLEIDHIDGNWKNNRRSNLQVLCPNCHSLTENYRALNKGHGRTYRKDFDPFIRKETRKNKKVYLCSCGNNKESKALLCSTCFFTKKRLKADSNFPPLTEVIANVKLKGFTAYGREIQRSDNGIRNFLTRNNIDVNKIKADID